MTKRGNIRRFINNDQGSAILAVVIAMLFVVALGTALLYAAYTALQVSVVARSDNSNFYDASAAMDGVKTGLQDEVAKALQLAYTDVLVAYGKGETTEPQEVFKNSFIDKLGESNDIGGGTFTVTENLLKVQVNVTKLQQLATAAYGGTATLTAAGTDASNKVVAVVGEESITIKGLQLKCVSPQGYESDISTDLVINIPEFFTGSAVSASLGDYAIIADKALKATSVNNNTVTGGIYVGADGVTVDPNSNLTISSGKIVSAGKISAGENSALTFSANGYSVWAQEIESKKNSEVKITANTYVADDLILNGGSKVTLNGRYYGFGSHDAGTAEKDDDKSSSVYVNSYVSEKKAELNISGLEQLSIAGVSFINGSYASGESIAAKTDQLAYLVPAEALTNYKSNPTVLQFKNNVLVEPVINSATVLWTIDGEDKTLAYYLGYNGTAKVKVTECTGTSGSLVNYYAQGTDVGYIFINFTNQEKANEYFKDYFTAKPNSIQQYLDIYLDLSRYSPTLTEITKGNTYRNTGNADGVKWENILGSKAFPNSQADFYAKFYAGVSQSQLDNYINTANLNALASGTTLKFGGTDSNPMAVVVKGNYTYPVKLTNLRVIIASGDVSINAEFSGIIICGGTVNVNGNVNYSAPSAQVLTSKTSDGKTPLSDYLNTDLFNGEQSTAENKWSPDKLVSYSNWQKQ